MEENGRKSLGKQSKCSKLFKKASEMPQNVPKWPLQTHRCPNGLVLILPEVTGKRREYLASSGRVEGSWLIRVVLRMPTCTPHKLFFCCASHFWTGRENHLHS